MSTANKLTYLNVTKQKLKQAINNIGGEVTDETTFRNYVAELENAYDRLPKTEFEEGESVTLENTLKGKLDFENGVVGIGQTEQDSTTGINLFVDITTQTLNGMTLTRTDNGYILNGTTTDNTTFRGIISNPINSNKTLVTKCNVTISNANVQIKTRSSNASQLRSITLSTADTWVVSSGEFQDAMCDIYIKTGTTLNNALLQPMLLNGTYTTINVPDYEKYTGGQTSPNPSYPQEIKYVRGRNRLKDTGWERKTAWNETRIQDSTTRIMSDYIEVDEHLNYYATIQSTSYCFGNVVLYNSSKVQFATYYNAVSQVINGTRSIGLKFPTNTKYARFVARNTDNTSEVTLDELAVIKPQLEEGTTSTPYLPYNTIEEVVSGKNKCNVGGMQLGTISQTDGTTISSSGDVKYSDYISVKPSTIYALSYTNGNPTIRIFKYNSNKTYLGTSVISGMTYTTDSDTYYIRVQGNISFIDNNFQIEQGSTATPYEPYITPTSYQLSLGEYKFYGIGTYRDYILRTTGKNLFNSEIEQGGYYANGSPSESANLIRTKDTMEIFDANSNYVFSNTNNLIIDRVLFFDNAKNVISRSDSIESAVIQSSIIPSNTKYIKLTIRKSNFGTLTPSELINPMLEEGSAATDYEPYGVGNWYKVGNLLKIDITKDLNWLTSGNGKWWYFGDYMSILPSAVNSEIMSNYFIKGNWNSTEDREKPNVISLGTASNGIIGITTASFASLDDLKTFLNNNNVYAIAQLRASTYTPITGTLAEQLEEWWNGQSLDGTTIIEGNGDLPMIIKVRGLKGE